jgi:hypothetical protein
MFWRRQVIHKTFHGLCVSLPNDSSAAPLIGLAMVDLSPARPSTVSQFDFSGNRGAAPFRRQPSLAWPQFVGSSSDGCFRAD